MLLLEKAWAKLHQSYDNIEGFLYQIYYLKIKYHLGGLVTEVLHDFTGAPTENKYLDEI